MISRRKRQTKAVNAAVGIKKDIRTKILRKLRLQKEADRTSKSFLIKKKLFSCLEFKKAKTILFYASFNGEVDTFDMIKEAIKKEKNIALPVIVGQTKKMIPSLAVDLKTGLEVNSYGIKQPKRGCLKPISKKDIDLVIVPGVAFDKRGNRLGRGRGYYDCFLKSLPKHIPTMGLAFNFQIVRNLPHQKHHDIPVDKVVFA